ncbi:MAG: glutamine--fructose-6-phosphate transaminase (isomerizing) [Oceanococcaceae bacterium]
MCGIVAALGQRDVVPILLEGLRRLEYRGYDSAGYALQDAAGIVPVRAVGKVSALATAAQADGGQGRCGIAHTRWATHGEVTEVNAHPQIARAAVAVVHNGIIENFETLKAELTARGAQFASQTDTEVIAHLIAEALTAGADLLEAVRHATQRLTGAYAIAVIARDAPERMIVARMGSPLVLGLGLGEMFAASDAQALLPVTQRFVYLKEGDIADLRLSDWRVFDAAGTPVHRAEKELAQVADASDKMGYRHFMLKEIFEQPQALIDTLHGRLTADRLLPESLGPAALDILGRVENVHIVACGTSYHAGMVGRYWIEKLARCPVNVELASEYRYRAPVVPANTLFVTLSQSGETADTLAALRFAQNAGYLATLTICNSAQSSMVHESDLVMLTRAGTEIGVASTKAFTTQLLSMLLVAGYLARAQNRLSAADETQLCRAVHAAPGVVEQCLGMEAELETLAEQFADKHHCLFLGRGEHYPIALEGALKLKEISYIHAEAYAAGELKHGPLALIDEDMPVIAVAPGDELADKLRSNLQVVRARGGQLYVFAGPGADVRSEPGVTVVGMPDAAPWLQPILYTIPLQLLAYHVAVLKGTDVDQPRNLAKSVTVE